MKYHIDLLPVDNSNEQLGIINLEIEDAKIIPHVMPNHKNKVTPTTTQVDDSHDQIGIINSRGNREKKKKLVHGPVKTFTAPTKVNSNLGARSIAASNIISSATESEESGSDMQLRFGISTGQINLSKMKSINSVYDNSPFAKILTAIARTIDSTKAIRKDENNMTFWISGIYSQGETFSMLNNPAATDQHSGLIFSTHYKRQPTQKIFGIAVDVGTSKSTVKTNKDQKTDTRMTQATLYYNNMITNNWKFSWHNSFMKTWDRHQRPFKDTGGSQQIAISNGTSIEFSSIAGVGYKYDFNSDSYLEPFCNFNYAYNKEFAHKEKNVDRYNILHSEVSSDQIGLQFGLRATFNKAINDIKSFLIMPKIDYTFYAKTSKIIQNSINISSGKTSITQSSTPGRHLLSTMIAIGVADQNTTTRLAYTGNFQRKRRSNEIMIDWSIRF